MYQHQGSLLAQWRRLVEANCPHLGMLPNYSFFSVENALWRSVSNRWYQTQQQACYLLNHKRRLQGLETSYLWATATLSLAPKWWIYWSPEHVHVDGRPQELPLYWCTGESLPIGASRYPSIPSLIMEELIPGHIPRQPRSIPAKEPFLQECKSARLSRNSKSPPMMMDGLSNNDCS